MTSFSCSRALFSPLTREFVVRRHSHLTNKGCLRGLSQTAAVSKYQPSPTASLGLVDFLLSKDILPTLQKLPEVQAVLAEEDATDYSPLERAADIFASQNMVDARAACQALYIEGLHQTGRDCTSALETLYDEIDDPVIELAVAKVLWMEGDIPEAKNMCDAILERDEVSPSNALVARTGQAITRLLMVSSRDDLFTVRDPFRMVVKHLEQRSSSPTALAAAHLNMGVAEAVWAESIGLSEAPLDGAMRQWREGLTALKSKIVTATPAVSYLKAVLHANMAWGLLHMPHESDYVKRASEYASQALAVYNKAGNPKTGLQRTLAIVAECYHKNGDAVTAEGLFQSAVKATSPLDTLATLQRRDALLGYAALCQDWEKRHGDAENLRKQASDVDASLPVGWRGKSGIHSTLWFWTAELLHR